MFGCDYLLEAPGQDCNGVGREQAPPQERAHPTSTYATTTSFCCSHFHSCVHFHIQEPKLLASAASAVTKARAARLPLMSPAPERTSDVRVAEWPTVGNLPVL